MFRLSPNTPASAPSPAAWTQVEAELIRHSDALAGAVSLQALAELGLALIHASVPLERASLSLLDPVTGHLRLIATLGNSDARVGQNLTRPRSVSEFVLREGRGLVLQGRVRTAQMQGVEDFRVQSSICLPLRGSRGPLGVLSLARGGGHAPFEDTDLAHASTSMITLSTALAHRLEMDRATRALSDLYAGSYEPGAPWRTRPFRAGRYECAAHVRRSWEGGGAFTACYAPADGRSWILAAEVGGQGLPAVERARTLEGMFLAAAAASIDFAELARRLDRLWAERFEARHPCVLWLAQPGTAGLVETCTLGTTSLLHMPAGGAALPCSGIAQPALGERREVAPHVQHHRLLAGDTLVFAGVGLIETADAGGEPFGLEKLAETVAEHRGQSPETLAGLVCDAALRHAGRSWWRSDLLIVTLRARREDP